MASKNQVTLTFAGDSKSLERAFDKVGAGAESMADDVESAADEVGRAGKSLDDVGEGFGTLDTRAMGFRDTITGVQDTFAAFNDEGATMQDRVLLLGTGIGDLASGFENLIVPLIAMKVESVKAFATMALSHAKNAAAAVASAATTVVSWVTMAAASIVNAAIIAASWLIAFAPIAIVIAAVIGLVVIIVKNWDWIKEKTRALWEWVKEKTAAAWDWIKSALTAAWDAIKSMISDRIEAVKSLLSRGWEAIKAVASAAWTAIKDKVSDQMEAVRNLINNKVEAAKRIFRNMVSAVRGIFRPLKEAIIAPIRSGLNAIKSVWNRTVGGRGISIPSFLGFGGISFRIPRLADGAVLMPRAGGVPFIGAEAGKPEAVMPLDKLESMVGTPGSQRIVLEINSGGSQLDDAIVGSLRKSVSNRGGDVQIVLGVN